MDWMPPLYVTIAYSLLDDLPTHKLGWSPCELSSSLMLRKKYINPTLMVPVDVYSVYVFISCLPWLEFYGVRLFWPHK